MKFSPLQIIKYRLYLLQLENYNIKRFWLLFWRRLFVVSAPMRQPIAWTAKLKLISVFAFGIQIVIIIAAALESFTRFNLTTATIIVIIITSLTFLLFGLWAIMAVIIITPVDYYMKKRLIRQAKQKLSQHPNVTVIGITGSYGKTTLKEFIAAVVSQKYKVLKTEGNKNTPLGIANLILDKLTPDIEVFIVEMGAYKKGDIKKLCDLTSPHISILTGINESHLERFGSIQNTIEAKFEIIKYASHKAMVMLNSDDDLVLKHYHDFIKLDKKIFFYSAYNHKLCQYRIIDRQFMTESLCQTANIIHNNNSLGTIKTMFLGEYVFGDIIAAIIVAEELKVPLSSVRHGLMNLKPIEHRLQPIQGENNILVIDDSYNGNINGVEEAVATLRHFKNRRKIYITPGLVESAHEARHLHYRIGKMLANTADIVILIKNSVTRYIEKGLLEANFNKENIIFFKNANEAHRKIQELTKPGDVVLFQNDWPDNYS